MNSSDLMFLAFEEASKKIGKQFSENNNEINTVLHGIIETGRIFAEISEKEFQEKSKRVRSQLKRCGLRRTHADPV